MLVAAVVTLAWSLLIVKECIVDGIDIDAKDVNEAKKKLRNVELLNIEESDLSSLKEKYDIVYFGDVIEHLVNPVVALKNVKRVLAPQGKVLLDTNMAHIAIRLSLLKGDFEYTETGLLDKTHLHFYTVDEIYRVFEEADYEINHIDFVKQDYPKALIKEWLGGMGLSANENFYKSMAKPEASAFQIIGTARPVRKGQFVKRKQFGPIDLFESFHHTTVTNLQDKINDLQTRYLVLEEANRQFAQ